MRNICDSLQLLLLFIMFYVLFSSELMMTSAQVKQSMCLNNTDCQNGGTCSQDSCQCVYGYSGPNCEFALQCSNDVDCKNHGKCVYDIPTNTSFCRCNQSATNGTFEGVFCERKMACHTNNYCRNGGLCMRDPLTVAGSNYCKCRHGFIGASCEENSSCASNGSCLNGGNCDGFKRCSCGNDFTGYFCDLQVSPALNYSTSIYWAFNKQIPEAQGAAKVIRDPQVGNVISFLRTGGGWVDIDRVGGTCFTDLDSCQHGISFSFWLQFLDGVVVMVMTKAGRNTVLVHVNGNQSLVIQLSSRTKRWNLQRHCFPVGWFHVTVTWDKANMAYYENGQLLSQTSETAAINSPLSQNASLLTVGSYKGHGGFSTMRMSDLALWTHALTGQDVNVAYLTKFSSPFTSRCLSNPCPHNQWCEDDLNNSAQFTCIQPAAGFYCSFDEHSCYWHNANDDARWKLFTKFGSLRHQHTKNSCSG